MLHKVLGAFLVCFLGTGICLSLFRFHNTSNFQTPPTHIHQLLFLDVLGHQRVLSECKSSLLSAKMAQEYATHLFGSLYNFSITAVSPTCSLPAVAETDSLR